MERIFGLLRSGYRSLALAGVIALGLAGASIPDARAADGRFYVGLNVPVMFIDDTESTTTGAQALNILAPNVRQRYKANSTSEYDTGFKIAGTAGYEFDGGLRVEGELFFARAEVDKVTYSGVPMVGKVDVPISGTADQLGGFANVWYDISTGSNWIPFIGGGIGFVRVDQGDLDYNSNTLFRTIVAARAGQQFAQNLPPVPGGFRPPTPCSLTISAPGWATGSRTTSSSRRATASSPRAILSSRRRTTRVPST